MDGRIGFCLVPNRQRNADVGLSASEESGTGKDTGIGSSVEQEAKKQLREETEDFRGRYELGPKSQVTTGTHRKGQERAIKNVMSHATAKKVEVGSKRQRTT